MLEKVYIKYRVSFIHLKLKKTRSREKSDFFQSRILLGARMYSDRLISRGRQPRPDTTANWQLSSEVIRLRTRGESEKIHATLTTTGMVSGKFAWGRIPLFFQCYDPVRILVVRNKSASVLRSAPNRFRRQGLAAGTSRRYIERYG